MRNYLLSTIILFIYAEASAQVLQPGFAAGLHADITRAFTDVHKSDMNPGFGASIQYNANSFIFVTAEYSNGRLSRNEPDIYGKSYNNHFNRVTATANISLGQFLKPERRRAHQLLYNIYAGAGAGMIWSDIAEPNALTQEGYGGITYQGTDLTIPVQMGLNFKAGGGQYSNGPFTFNINLQHNFTFTEMLDGYDPKNSDNRIKDNFSVLSTGIKYNFGRRVACFN